MADYIPLTAQDEREMLRAIGVSGYRALFEDIPNSIFLEKPLNLPAGLSQQEVLETVTALAQKNAVYKTVLRGAGSYKHFIPPVVTALSSRAEFVTAYTPYQAELSQGILQAIFEYQTMIAALTGMDASNASLYNGATAAAEAIFMCAERERNEALVAANINPATLEVIRTYCAPKGITVRVIPTPNGICEAEAFLTALTAKTACIYAEQPSFFGTIEDLAVLADAAHAHGAKLVTGCNPIALALLKSPGECGADIAVGEGQPLGLPLSFGGPYLGFIACRQKELRKLPGRIVGETLDRRGNRAYVLTLQAREQHIRRDKAASNICSNEALCALTAAIYLAAMGKEGLREVAGSCLTLAHYAAKMWSGIPGITLKYKAEFFHEFITVIPGKAHAVAETLAANGILAGLPLSKDELLWCVTECVKQEEIDTVTALLKEVLQ